MIKHRNKLILAACAAAFLAPALARAQSADPPMPSYDVAATCRGAADAKGCASWQNQARDVAAQRWASLTPAVRKKCIENDLWNDYPMLVACINSPENGGKPGSQ